jgi:hypothetical protein
MSGYWQHFDLSNGVNILRLICGLFFIPHIVGKFTEPATLNFFKAAKFNPPATWMYVAGGIETLLTIGLVFAIYTPYVRRRRGHLEGDQEVDLGDRRHRILRVLDAGVRRARGADLACGRVAQITWPDRSAATGQQIETPA